MIGVLHRIFVFMRTVGVRSWEQAKDTALHCAARHGQLQAVMLLLQLGAQPLVQNKVRPSGEMWYR